MKRKPIDVFAGLFNVFNSLNMDQEYSINEVHEKTGYHWETIQDYVISLSFIQLFGPKIKYNPVTRKINISQDPEYMSFLSRDDALLIFLFRNRIFNEESAIGQILVEKRFESKVVSSLERAGCIVKAERNNKGLLYLSRKGKFKAQAALASINREMGDYIENAGKTLLNLDRWRGSRRAGDTCCRISQHVNQ